MALFQQSVKPSFFASVARAASGTLVSRVFGLVRDVMFAVLMPKDITDTFFVAFRIPNLFRRLFGEGALTVSFIPVYRQVEHESGEAEAKRFVERFYGALMLMLLGVVALGWIFAADIMNVLTPGWAQHPEKLSEATVFLKWCFPYLFFIACVACFMGMQHIRHRFWMPSFSPTLLNWSFIACIGLSMAVGQEAFSWSSVLIAGVLMGGVSQFLINMFAVKKLHMPIVPVFKMHPGTWRTLALMLPSVLALSSLQLNHFITSIFASYLEPGAISALYYASRLVEFPLGMIAVSIAVVLLPRISHDAGEATAHAHRMLMRTLYILLPISIATYVGADMWVALIFGYGAFDPGLAELTSLSLKWGALSIAGGGVYRVMSSFEFSKQKPWLPAWLSLGGALVHGGLCAVLVKPLGIEGIALSLGVVSIAQGLWVACVQFKGVAFTQTREMFMMVISCGVMTAGLLLSRDTLAGYSVWIQAPLFVMVGAVVYGICSHVLKLDAWREWQKVIFKVS